MTSNLPGTLPFGPDYRLYNHSFTDYYPKQWNAVLQHMKQDLERHALLRNQNRSPEITQLHESRNLLFKLSGSPLFHSSIRSIQMLVTEPADHANDTTAAIYRIRLDNNILLSGLVYLPQQKIPIGVVCWADSSYHLEENVPDIETYLHHGFIVIRPFLAAEVKSFTQDPQRKWYQFVDHDLLQLFTFIIGGSLCGLQVVEVFSAIEGVTTRLGLQHDEIPIIIDFRGRHLLTGAVTTALHPDWAHTLLMDHSSDRLNHQELDHRSNTIWSFHQNFDALTIFQLNGNSNLLFIEPNPTPTPTPVYAVTQAWFDRYPVPHKTISSCSRQHLLAQLSRSLSTKNTKIISKPIHRDLHDEYRKSTAADCYMDTMESKLIFLEQQFAAARTNKQQKYALPQMNSVKQYKQIVHEALLEVMGDSLPRAPLHPRTHKVTHQSPNLTNPQLYDMYEVLLQTVENVDTAGYLLIPKGAGPFPAVICQHGLTGRPEDVIGLTHKWAYYRIAHILAEKGYVTYVPFMNWGWGGTPCRDELTKHAYALGRTSNRYEAAQLHAIVDFLQQRPEVRADKIGFYGLSYGGHASVWLGACEPRLAAIVTAGHFNDWHKKLTSTEISAPCTRPTSYICVNEGMDMFTYNVLNLLNHTELVTAHVPRPHFIENGVKDAVAPVTWVDSEFAKVKKVFEWAGQDDAAELSHFAGPHRIWAEESLLFLRKHLYESLVL